jgi:hypothetical protein
MRGGENDSMALSLEDLALGEFLPSNLDATS